MLHDSNFITDVKYDPSIEKYRGILIYLFTGRVYDFRADTKEKVMEYIEDEKQVISDKAER